MIGKYGPFIVISLLAVLACPPALASEIGEYELVATWGSLGADDGRFNNPTGIAVDGEGNVYVADTGNDRIQKFDNTGAFLLKWGTRGSGDGEFYSPRNIALDADGMVYVVDGSRIQVFAGNGTFIKKWGSYGSGEEQLQSPRSIAFDTDGNAYVIAGGGIKKFGSDGNFLTAWGALGTYDGEFNNPTDVAVDGAGNVYVADCYNNRIQKFDGTGTFLLKWGSGEGQFQQPNGLAIDADGNIYVAAWDRPVQKFDSSGNLLAKATDIFYDNKDIVVGADGTIYVTNSRDDCVRVFKQSSAPIPTPTPTPSPTPTVARTGSDANVIAPGNTIYVGEENLNFATGFGLDPISRMIHFNGPYANPIIDRVISITNPADFELTPSAVGSTTGTYYTFGDTPDVLAPADSSGYVIVKFPSTALDVVLNNSRLDSVNGRSISRNTALAFKLTNNLNGFSNLDVAAQPAIKIDVTLPDGRVTNQFGGVDLTAIPMNGTTVYMGPVNLAGVEAGTYTAQAKWPSGTDFYNKGYDSNTVAFEVLSKKLAITSNKDTVVRGNSFTVTITGESAKAYHLFIKPEESLADSDYPWIVAGQNGVSTVGMINPERNATVMTTAGGTRTTQFNTNRSTDAQTFTIRVELPGAPSTYDEVKVRVEEGAVTITTYGGTRYLGEEVTLYGINTDSETTYLFLTGSDLATSGIKLSDIVAAVEDGNPGTFTCVHVEADDTWSYKWNTADIGRRLNAGNYTIYAVAEPRSRDNLSDTKHASIDIQLKLPSIKAATSSDTVARGDDLVLDGTVTGRPDSVRIWIIGPDYLNLGVPIVLRGEYSSSNHFTYRLTGAETSNLTAGRYFVVVQHPMVNGFGVTANGTTISGPGVTPTDLAGLQPSEAANALISALESPYVDDTYAKLTFTVGAPMIRIDPIERTDRIDWFDNIDLINWFDWRNAWTCGETFTVTGTTCYPAGTTLAYTITSRKNGAHIFSGDIIVADEGAWSFDVDTAAIGPGEYIVRVMSLDDQSSASASFTVRDGVVNPIPPAGATYRVERISVNPSLGERVVLNGIIDAPWAGCQEDLGFSTDLLEPAWSYAIEVEREVIRSGSQGAGSFTLSAFELDYGEADVRVLLHLSGTVQGTGAEDPALLRIFQRDAGGGTVPDSGYSLPFTPSGNDPVQPFGDNLTLSPGWNFISIPRPLAAGNDTAMIFAGINTTGRSVLRYNTTIRDWTALAPADRLPPLEGFWIYSAGPATIPLNLSTDPLLPPAERTLSAGWNAIGTTGTAPATAKDTLYSVNREWSTLIGFNAGSQSFEAGIVNGGSGANADTRPVYPGRGYWLSMSGPGTLYAIGA